MHFLSVFALACAALQAVSAFPVSHPTNNPRAYNDLYAISSRDAELLEARGKGYQHKNHKKRVPPSAPKVTFEKGKDPHFPGNHLNRLNLHSKKRKAVTKWHQNVVEEHMKTVKNAHSAKIINLAHGKGSKDPNIHISAMFRDKAGKIIPTPQRGNGVLKDTTHVYVNKEHPKDGYRHLPIEYKKAIDRTAKAEGRHHDVGKA